MVETGFVCNGTSTTNATQCYLLAISISKVSILKNPMTNEVDLTFALEPKGVTLFNNVNWTAVLQANGLGDNTSSVTYDSTTGLIHLNLNYSSNIDGLTLTLDLNLSSAGPSFSLLDPAISTFNVVDDHNQMLDAFSGEEYSMATIVRYISTGLAVAGVLLFILGFVGGKLVGLEFVAIIQLTFLSLLTLHKLSPTFYAL